MRRALLYLLVAASYLLLAGGPRWSIAALLAMGAGAALFGPRLTLASAAASRAFERTLPLLLGAVAIQLLPLPSIGLGWLSPHALPLRRELSVAPVSGLLPLTIDAAATATSVGMLSLAMLAYLTARAVFDLNGGVRRFCRLLAGFAALVALGAVVQRAAAPMLVMGLVVPDAPGARPFGPFINRNHFAGWLMMVVPVVAGYLVAHLRRHLAGEPGWRRRVQHVTGSIALPLFAAIATTLFVLSLTLSRSAVLGCGVAGAAWWLLARRRLQMEPHGWLLTIGVIGVAVLAAAAVVDLDAWALRLGSTLTAGQRPDDRLVIWRETLAIVGDFWPTGTGMGTYGTAMLSYQQSRIWVPHLAAWAHFNQAHNHYLQILAEGGLLVAVPAGISLAMLIGAAKRALVRDRSEIFWIRAGAAASLAGVAAQSVWEIPLVMPANAVLAAVLVALLLHEPRARQGTSLASNHATSE